MTMSPSSILISHKTQKVTFIESDAQESRQIGLAITFVTAREFNQLRAIESIIKRKSSELLFPILDAFQGQIRLTVERLMEVVEKNYEQYRGVAEDLLEQTDSITLLSAH